MLVSLALLILGCEAPVDTAGRSADGFADVRRTFTFTDRYGADIDISYLDTGGASDTAFVLLHGFGGSAYAWHAVLPALSERHRTIAIDLKGFGESAKPDDDHYSVFDQAEIVAGLMEHLRLRHVIPGGHSMGGTIALVLVTGAREGADYTIDRLILCGAPAFRQRLPLFIMALDLPFIGEAVLHIIPPATVVQMVLKAGYYNDDLIEDAEIEAYARGIESAGGRRALAATASALADLNGSGHTFDFDKVRMPALVIWGKHDTVVPRGYAFALRDALPGPVAFHMLPQCGHIPPTEQPEEVLRLITDFLGDY